MNCEIFCGSVRSSVDSSKTDFKVSALSLKHSLQQDWKLALVVSSIFWYFVFKHCSTIKTVRVNSSLQADRFTEGNKNVNNFINVNVVRGKTTP